MKNTKDLKTMTSVEIDVCVADLVTFSAEAIVCPSHFSFLAGSGLCGAIHKAAGDELEKECRIQRVTQFGPKGIAPAGFGLMTQGYKLKAKKVIHAVVPRPATFSEEKDRANQLADCYRTIIGLAENNSISSVAIPSLGTGVYNWPKDLAVLIAVTTVKGSLKMPLLSLKKITFVCPDQTMCSLYKISLSNI